MIQLLMDTIVTKKGAPSRKNRICNACTSHACLIPLHCQSVDGIADKSGDEDSAPSVVQVPNLFRNLHRNRCRRCVVETWRCVAEDRSRGEMLWRNEHRKA